MPAGMSGIALPDMSESGPPDPLARLGERLDKARARREGNPLPEPDNADLQRGAGLGFQRGHAPGSQRIREPIRARGAELAADAQLADRGIHDPDLAHVVAVEIAHGIVQ